MTPDGWRVARTPAGGLRWAHTVVDGVRVSVRTFAPWHWSVTYRGRCLAADLKAGEPTQADAVRRALEEARTVLEVLV